MLKYYQHINASTCRRWQKSTRKGVNAAIKCKLEALSSRRRHCRWDRHRTHETITGESLQFGAYCFARRIIWSFWSEPMQSYYDFNSRRIQNAFRIWISPSLIQIEYSFFFIMSVRYEHAQPTRLRCILWDGICLCRHGGSFHLATAHWRFSFMRAHTHKFQNAKYNIKYLIYIFISLVAGITLPLPLSPSRSLIHTRVSS